VLYINPQLQNFVPGTVYELFYRDIHGSAHLNTGVSYKSKAVEATKQEKERKEEKT
jgi:hypothetical protein